MDTNKKFNTPKRKLTKCKFKEHAIVYTTIEDPFTHIAGNRRIKHPKLKKIKKAIMEHGDYATPMIVDEHGTILDGQHRHHVRNDLRLPHFFIISNKIPDEKLTMVQTVNSASSNWTLEDYTNSFVDRGNPNYIRLDALLTDFPFKHITFATILVNKGETKGMPDGFKEGKFKLTEQDDARIRKICKLVMDFEKRVEKFTNRNFITACMLMFKTSGYSHKRMLSQIKKHGMLEKQSSIFEYMRVLTEIYNANLRSKNRIEPKWTIK